MNCSNCGVRLNKTQKFCANCGAKVDDQQEGAEIEVIKSVDNTENLVHQSNLNEQNYNAQQTDSSGVQGGAQQNVVLSTNNVQQNGAQPTNSSAQNLEGHKRVCGFGIAGMVLGVISLFSVLTIFFALITSIIGIVFSSISISKFKSGKYKLKGFHVAGLVLSIVALSLVILFLFYYIILLFGTAIYYANY